MDYIIINHYIAYWGEHFRVPLLSLGPDNLPLPASFIAINAAINYFNDDITLYDEAMALALCFIDYQKKIDPRLSSNSLGDYAQSYTMAKGVELNPFYEPLLKMAIIKSPPLAWVGVP